MNMRPVLREKTIDPSGVEYVTEWYCVPPAVGQLHVVRRDEFLNNYTLRRIYEWDAVNDVPNPDTLKDVT